MFDVFNRFGKQILFDFSKFKTSRVVISRNIFTSNEGNNSETTCGSFQNWELIQMFKKEISEANYKPAIQRITLNADISRTHLWVSFISWNKQSLIMKVTLLYLPLSFSPGLALLAMSERIGRLENFSFFEIVYLKLKTILWGNYF